MSVKLTVLDLSVNPSTRRRNVSCMYFQKYSTVVTIPIATLVARAYVNTLLIVTEAVRLAAIALA